MDTNRQHGVEYAQPLTYEAREVVAEACTLGLRLTLPTYVDDMRNTADLTFNGWPERLYVLSNDWRVVYKGGKGPYGFDLEELEGFLANQMQL